MRVCLCLSSLFGKWFLKAQHGSGKGRGWGSLRGSEGFLVEWQVTSVDTWCGHWPAVSVTLQLSWDKFTWTTETCGGKGTAQSLSQGESALTLALTGFYSFLGTLHGGWSSFAMHRFTLGGYLLQTTTERMLPNTSKMKDICKCKGKSGWIGYTHPWKV